MRLSAFRWVSKILTTKSAEVKRNSSKVLKSLLNDLSVHFQDETKRLREQVSVRLGDQSRAVSAEEMEDIETDEMRSSVELPTVSQKGT